MPVVFWTTYPIGKTTLPEAPSPTCALMTPSTLTIEEPSTLTPPSTSVDAFGSL